MEIKPVWSIVKCREIEKKGVITVFRKSAYVEAEVVEVGEMVNEISVGDRVKFNRKRCVPVGDYLFVEESDIETKW